MSNGIKGKVVVITGVSGGLGEAPARLPSAQAQAICWAHGAPIASGPEAISASFAFPGSGPEESLQKCPCIFVAFMLHSPKWKASPTQ